MRLRKTVKTCILIAVALYSASLAFGIGNNWYWQAREAVFCCLEEHPWTPLSVASFACFLFGLGSSFAAVMVQRRGQVE